MADGNVFRLVSAVLGHMDTVLDYLFYAGVAYGARIVSRTISHACSGIRTYFIPFGRIREDEDISEKYGKWAVITGGTSGIGLAYAHEFARRKMNVVLISRSYDDLVNIISELQSQYDVLTIGIYADFAVGAKVYQDVEETLKDLEVGILVNNASVRYDHPQYFALVPHSRVWQILNANISAVTTMTHMLLPKMLQRGKGAIINVCSIAACTPPIPLTAEYTASMAYVDKFSQALYHENKQKGICVQTLLPCFLAQSGVKLPTLFAPTADTYVRHAISTLGIKSRICGYWPHAIQSWLLLMIPESLWVWFTRYFNATTRTRCLAEKEVTGGPRFTRRHIRNHSHGNTPGQRYPTLRRTPSPHGRVHADSFTESASPGIQRRSVPGRGRATDLKRKISLEEITHSRSSSSGSHISTIPPPIREDSTGSTGLSTPEIGQAHSPKFDRAFAPHAAPYPRQSSTVDSASFAQPRKSSSYMRTSRVLVMPSVAMVSYSPEPSATENSHY